MHDDVFCRITFDAKFRTLYTCSKCEDERPGTQQHITLNVRTPNEVAQALREHRQTSHAMPVGWSFNGSFCCDKCLKETA